MTSKNSKRSLEGRQCSSMKYRVVNKQNLNSSKLLEGGECSMDERAVRCCSLRSIIPHGNKARKQCKQIVPRNSNALSLNDLQTRSKQNRSINKDEYMYDLAHFLFKISDLLLQVTEYEKVRCSKEVDLRKMLNIVKTEIMRAFLRGKTKRTTMNKIVTRLIYLDKYIQQMNKDLGTDTLKTVDLYPDETRRGSEDSVEGDDTLNINFEQNIEDLHEEDQKHAHDKDELTRNYSTLKIQYKTKNYDEYETTISEDKQKQSDIDFNRIRMDLENTKELTPSTCHFTSTEQQQYLNDTQSVTADHVQYMHEITLSNDDYDDDDDDDDDDHDHDHDDAESKSQLCRQCISNKLQYCFESRKQEKVKKQYFITKSSETINSKLKLVNNSTDLKICYCHECSEPGVKPCEKNSTPLTSQHCHNRDKSIYENQVNKKNSANKVDPEKWVEIDTHVKMKEVPINKLNKKISAQQLKKKCKKFDKTEGKSQTDEIFMNDNADHQIISMNVLYSKTHVRYIIPDWMKVSFDIDQTPKVLCKQDLDDGVALTSYQTDPDGTIHFTLAYSSEILCNLLNSKPATGDLVSKLQEIKSIWADSAKILYETLLKEYEEQNTVMNKTENIPKIVGCNAFKQCNNNNNAAEVQSMELRDDSTNQQINTRDESELHQQSLEQYSICSSFKKLVDVEN